MFELIMGKNCAGMAFQLLQLHTTIVVGDDKNKLLMACNGRLVNAYNLTQLSAWRANVDMQYCISKQKVIETVPSTPPSVCCNQHH